MSSSVAKMPSVADQLLIEEVRLHECLYAVTTKSNKDNQSRDEAWRSISKTLGKSGKWHFFLLKIWKSWNAQRTPSASS